MRGWAVGCFSSKISLTDLPLMTESRCNEAPTQVESDSSLIAAFMFAMNIRSENLRVNQLEVVLCWVTTWGRRAWIARPYFNKELMSPVDHKERQRSRRATVCFDEHWHRGRCSRRWAITITAYRATDSNTDELPYDLYKRASFQTKEVPALPEWILQTFFLQWTTSS